MNIKLKTKTKTKTKLHNIQLTGQRTKKQKDGHQSIFQNYEWSIFRNSDIRPSRMLFKHALKNGFWQV